MPNLSSKFLLINKSGYYLVDTFFAQLILLGCALFFFAVSKLRYRSHFCLAMFKKINPYLMSYVFRLLLLELLLSMMLYAANL